MLELTSTLCFTLLALFMQPQKAVRRFAPVLTRNIEKGPASKVTIDELSPAMKKAIEDGLRDEPDPESYAIYRIAAAPPDHHLYFIHEDGKSVCGPNEINCPSLVLDETPEGVTVVREWSGAGIAVVRRPGRQVPDIATYEALGHFQMFTTVYRYDGRAWKPYLCKDISITGEGDPHPEWVAYQPCTP